MSDLVGNQKKLFFSSCGSIIQKTSFLVKRFEPHHEKTNILHICENKDQLHSYCAFVTLHGKYNLSPS